MIEDAADVIDHDVTQDVDMARVGIDLHLRDGDTHWDKSVRAGKDRRLIEPRHRRPPAGDGH